MKKVLFICSLYRPHVGGIETIVHELTKYYESIGVESIILTKKWPITLSDTEENDGSQIFRVVNARSEEEFLEVADWVKDNDLKIKADIIHVFGIRRPLPLIGLLLSRKWKVPIMCTIGGGDIPDAFDPGPGRIWNEGKDFIPNVLEQSDCVNCASKALIGDLKLVMPKLEKVELLYSGMDFSNITKNNNMAEFDNYIFCFRRLDPSKGIDVLIKAFNLIKDTFPKLNLIIAGEGSEEANLKKLVSDLSLDERIIFIGTVPLQKGISLLRGAQLTVVPSLSEGGGLVNIEAQAVGCPVIASRVGGIPEYLLEGESGLMFEVGNYKELASKIILLLNDKTLRKKLVDGGIKHAKSFDWNILAPEYIKQYNSLIDKYDKNKRFVPWSQLTEKMYKIIK